MKRIKSRINTQDATFKENDKLNRERAADLAALLATIRRGGSEKARERHLSQGKLMVRDRIEAVLDPGSPFLELSPLAAHGVYPAEVPAAGLITGIGQVHGRQVMIVANDAVGQRGHLFPRHGEKAPAGPGGGPGKPAALHLPGRLGRGVSAPAGRGLSRP